MKFFSQFIKRLKFFWNAQCTLGIMHERIELLHRNFLAFDERLHAIQNQYVTMAKVSLSDSAVIAEELGVLRKQLADLRQIVANIRKEAEQKPLAARNGAQLRSFVNSEESNAG